MDWGHAALGVVALALLGVVTLRRKLRRSLHIRIDWEEEGHDPG